MKGLRLTFANVGYGEAILLEAEAPDLKDGIFRMIIDGGSGEAEEFAESTSGRIPFAEFLKMKEIRHVDVMVNTHIHEDHTCGLLPLSEELKIDSFWQSLPVDWYQSTRDLDVSEADTPSAGKYLSSLNDYRKICSNLAEQGCRIEEVSDGLTLRITDDFSIRVIAPSDRKKQLLLDYLNAIYEAENVEVRRLARNRADAAMNNLSIIVMAEYAGKRILLPGDTAGNGYTDVAAELKADIFKVGHHGQKDGVSKEIFARIQPDYVICCASSDRRYNSAAPEILGMMEEMGAEICYSDCPSVAGFTEHLKPHHALIFEISPNGEIVYRYES